MKPLPQSLCDRAKFLCTIHSQQDVANILGLQKGMITKMKQRGWKSAGTKAFRPVPTDFAIVSPGKSVRYLSRHYRAGHMTVERWLEQLQQMAKPLSAPPEERENLVRKQGYREKPIFSQGSIVSL